MFQRNMFEKCFKERVGTFLLAIVSLFGYIIKQNQFAVDE